MRRIPRLGFLNLALVSLYFAPIWAREALRILLLPYRAFEESQSCYCGDLVARGFRSRT